MMRNPTLAIAALLTFTCVGCNGFGDSADDVEVLSAEEAAAKAEETIDADNLDEQMKALEEELMMDEANG